MKLPLEFVDRMKMVLGDEYYEFEKCYDRPVNHGLRVNTLKISVEEFVKISPFKLEKVAWSPEGFYIEEHQKTSKHPFYHAGLYYLQEPSAMAPAEFIQIKPGDKVLDLCAAPGGKSTQIASKLSGQGLLVTNDINRNRTKALVRNIELFGAKNVSITNESPDKLSEIFNNYFDKILVDAPCSGEGMFGKDENATKSWESFSPQKCYIMQKDILNSAAKMLKPEGYILYSTCTFSIQENEQVIDEFLNINTDFELITLPKFDGITPGMGNFVNNDELSKALRFWPHKLKGEGHFLALLRKKDGNEYKNNLKSYIDKIDLTLFNEFCDKYLDINFFEKYNNFEMIGDYLYYTSKELPNLRKLKVIRPGWFLGTFKKGRFEPSHGLALGLMNQSVRNTVNLSSDSDLVIKYLKGETLEIKANKGYNLITVDGFSLGWSKGDKNILKNEYPSAWRIL